MTETEVDYCNLDIGEVASRLETNAKSGIPGDSGDVKRRQEKYGINKLSPPEKEPFYKKVLDNLKEPIIVVLLIACVLSIAIKEYKDGTGVGVAIFLSTFISVYMEGRGDKALEKLNEVASNIKVKVLRYAKLEQINSEDVCAGELISLEAGDKVPADGRLVECDGLEVDESILTGESLPVKKHCNTILEKVGLADKKNFVYSGTYVSKGRGKFLATGVGDHTEIGAIAKNLSEAEDSKTPLQQKLADFGKKISIACTIVAGILFVMQVLKGGDYSFGGLKDAFEVSIALIVAAVPEGLPTMIALTLAFNTLKMKDKNALVRKMIACETIGSVDVICSDKTGTLTMNKMTIVKAWIEGKFINPSELNNDRMITNMAVNSTADVIEEDGQIKDIGSSSECAMLRCLKTLGMYYKNIRDGATVVKVFDFSSDRKMMSTIIDTGGNFRYTIYSKGAPERILDRSNTAYINGELQAITPKLKAEIEAGIKELQSNAMRVLAFAEKTSSDVTDLENENGLTFVGFVGIEDPARPDVKDAIAKCHAAGIDVKMLTGDNKVTAAAIAKQLGMIKGDSLVFEVKEIETLSDAELIKILPKIVVIARCTPAFKQRVARLLKAMDKSVAMTGDGVNDSPALKEADVGIAMGITGTEVAKQASDIVLLDDSFSTIAIAIMWGRGIYRNFQRFITFQLTVNVVAFVTAFAATILGFGLPFTTLQLLWVNIIMDGPPALSLGLEPPRPELMLEKPIPRKASIITKDMLKKVVMNGAYIAVSILALMKYQFLGGTPEQQSTIVFSCFVFFQIWNSFNCREFGLDSVFPNFLKNRVALLLIGGAGLVQILLVQIAGSWFDTVPLPAEIWGMIIAYTFSVIIVSEILKVAGSLTHKTTATAPQEN